MTMRDVGVSLLRRSGSVLKGLALAAAAIAAYVGAFQLRFDLSLEPEEQRRLVVTLPVLIASRAAVNWYFGLHRHWWRFVSMTDLRRILGSVVAGSVLFTLALPWTLQLNVPRSILLIEPVLTFLFMAGLMVASRWLHGGHFALRPAAGRRVLVIGAGQTGNGVARELLWDPARYVPVGFVDDEPRKHGALVQGLPVLGAIEQLPALVTANRVDELIIAMPSADRRRIRDVVTLCKATGKRFRIMPAAADLIDGRVTIDRLRDVRIEDLLGRPPVSFELETVRPLLRSSVVLVTGASGSIGSELCRQVLACNPERLVMVDRNENTLHFLHTELHERFPDTTLCPVVADITDPVRMQKMMAQHRPRVVFQAAAYKHVPLMEHNPCEAIRNNVIGTRIIANLSSLLGVERFVMISTDKAINPTSVMGASKRVAEVLLQVLQRTSKTRFIAVRFGNVLGSDGSVVPLFRKQIANGGPVTVTHPDVMRFFMIVDEAVHLVLQAGVLGTGGEIFELDMGEPVRILDLATDMIRLSGLEPNVDIELRITGLRPGEKLYEELITESEVAVRTIHPKILRLAEQKNRRWTELGRSIDELAELALSGRDAAVRAKLHELVPEFRPPEEQNGDGAQRRVLDLRAFDDTMPLDEAGVRPSDGHDDGSSEWEPPKVAEVS
ncbi:MAG: nucleoside-diphosphate sugar epimerase/dehydratase [Thermodesulfobacteriota bacterium]